MARMSPQKRSGERTVAAYDTTGMDADMRHTLTQESGRRERVRAATSPYASAVDRFGGMIRKMFPKKAKKGGK